MSGKLYLFGIALMIVGCAPQNNVGTGGFRDLDAPMGATTRFDAAAFSGDWQIVASFTPLRRDTVTFKRAPETNEMTLTSTQIPAFVGDYRIGAPGELIPQGTGRERLIVMWVDEGFRTAAVGTPSGSFGMMLNRTGDLPADRDVAAREVFRFYGWDVSALRGTLQ